MWLLVSGFKGAELMIALANLISVCSVFLLVYEYVTHADIFGFKLHSRTFDGERKQRYTERK